MSEAKPRALLVDDEESMRGLIRELLEAMGFEVEEFSNGEDALVAFNGDRGGVALLVTDYAMPGRVSGTQLAHGMRIFREDLSVLIVTGTVQEKIHPEGHGFLVLRKPFSIEQFKAAIAEAIKEA